MDLLEVAPVERIDDLGFGLIVMDRQGDVIGYKTFESQRAGMAREPAMTGPEPAPDVGRAGRDGEDAGLPVQLQELLPFFYQCPIGLIVTGDAGVVLKINPAAARMPAPALLDAGLAGDLAEPVDDTLTKVFPPRRRRAADLVLAIETDPQHLGPLVTGRRILIPADVFGQALDAGLGRLSRALVTYGDLEPERLADALLADLLHDQAAAGEIALVCLQYRGIPHRAGVVVPRSRSLCW